MEIENIPNEKEIIKEVIKKLGESNPYNVEIYKKRTKKILDKVALKELIAEGIIACMKMGMG